MHAELVLMYRKLGTVPRVWPLWPWP